MLGEACFSPCREYRYTLSRDLLNNDRQIAWLLLNPSTADAYKNDPTVARCCNYSVQSGFGKAVVINLFALRSTDPKMLKTYISSGRDPVGEDNNNYIIQVANKSEAVVCAWGRHGDLLNRGRYVTKMLIDNNLSNKLHYLKILGDNTPGHPLYLPKNLELQRWYGANEYCESL